MDRNQLLRRAMLLSVLSIGISAAVGATAVVVATATGSLSLLGFGADAVIDSAASVVLVWRFRTEVREPHRADRIELIAETVIGGVLLLLAAYLAISAVGALITDAHPSASLLRTTLLGVGLVALPPLALAKYRVAQALGSRALRADSILTAVAAVLAVIGVAALALSALFDVNWGDAVGALVVAAIVAREGWAGLRAVQST
jgi:divalent metal cation (Fe/Co/Zn/Cd) transporter